jgi:hypothetical protein
MAHEKDMSVLHFLETSVQWSQMSTWNHVPVRCATWRAFGCLFGPLTGNRHDLYIPKLLEFMPEEDELGQSANNEENTDDVFRMWQFSLSVINLNFGRIQQPMSRLAQSPVEHCDIQSL